MYITDIVYLLDVLVVIVYMSCCNCWDYLLLHDNWGECSEHWAGACRWGGGVEYLTEKKFFAKKCSWGLKTQKKKLFFGGGGGDFGVFGAPHAPTPKAPKARDGRYCNVPPSVRLSVCPSVCLSITFSFRTVTKKLIDVFSRNFAGMCTMSWGCAV